MSLIGGAGYNPFHRSRPPDSRRGLSQTSPRGRNDNEEAKSQILLGRRQSHHGKSSSYYSYSDSRGSRDDNQSLADDFTPEEAEEPSEKLASIHRPKQKTSVGSNSGSNSGTDRAKSSASSQGSHAAAKPEEQLSQPPFPVAKSARSQAASAVQGAGDKTSDLLEQGHDPGVTSHDPTDSSLKRRGESGRLAPRVHFKEDPVDTIAAPPSERQLIRLRDLRKSDGAKGYGEEEVPALDSRQESLDLDKEATRMPSKPAKRADRKTTLYLTNHPHDLPSQPPESRNQNDTMSLDGHQRQRSAKKTNSPLRLLNRTNTAPAAQPNQQRTDAAKKARDIEYSEELQAIMDKDFRSRVTKVLGAGGYNEESVAKVLSNVEASIGGNAQPKTELDVEQEEVMKAMSDEGFRSKVVRVFTAGGYSEESITKLLKNVEVEADRKAQRKERSKSRKSERKKDLDLQRPVYVKVGYSDLLIDKLHADNRSGS